jgi:hypothetical protein
MREPRPKLRYEAVAHLRLARGEMSRGWLGLAIALPPSRAIAQNRSGRSATGRPASAGDRSVPTLPAGAFTPMMLAKVGSRSTPWPTVRSSRVPAFIWPRHDMMSGWRTPPS